LLLKLAGGVAGIVVVVAGVAAAVGAAQPVVHVASRSETFALSQENLWDLSLAAFRRSNNGSYAIVQQEHPRRFVTAIVDKKLPYGGTWAYELAPAAGGTTLTVVERGEVYNPVFRFVSRYVIGHTRALDAYFADLRKAAETARSAKA
ncbi:MAG TPA: hypothetical protein VN224_13895, partial [Xanthomonadales bacterium]|nr:hypothetical protein [Xanthomonadales bacterium]